MLCYESPSSLGFSPSAFVDVAPVMDAKLDLIRAHWSQVLGTDMVDEEVLWAQARMRGFAGRVRMAEAFEVPRLLVDPVAHPAEDLPHSQDVFPGQQARAGHAVTSEDSASLRVSAS